MTAAVFEPARAILRDAITARAFPGAAVEVGSVDGVLWQEELGRLTYAADAPVVTRDTIYDLASLAKVIATASAAMRQIDAGALRLDDLVARWLPGWRGSDRASVTIADLLSHASGVTAYLPLFRDHHGRADFERTICELPLESPPRTQAIYSDLGFILLGFILETAAAARLDAQAAAIASALVAEPLQFTPPREWRTRCAPTEVDGWRGRLLVGEVHDENAWALGGVAGHAGLFGTARAVGAFARVVLAGLQGDAQLARPATLARFIARTDVPGSSRALGWDTMLPTSSCGTRMSSRAFGHTGFTGTSLWIDPQAGVYVVLLTNRVHPTRENNAITGVRPRFHDAVMDAIAGGEPGSLPAGRPAPTS